MGYLREYEFIFEMALAHESGGPGVLIDDKTKGRKSRATVPLNTFMYISNSVQSWIAELFKLHFGKTGCTLGLKVRFLPTLPFMHEQIYFLE
jgi:hypothetical protein